MDNDDWLESELCSKLFFGQIPTSIMVLKILQVTVCEIKPVKSKFNSLNKQIMDDLRSSVLTVT